MLDNEGQSSTTLHDEDMNDPNGYEEAGSTTDQNNGGIDFFLINNSYDSSIENEEACSLPGESDFMVNQDNGGVNFILIGNSTDDINNEEASSTFVIEEHVSYDSSMENEEHCPLSDKSDSTINQDNGGVNFILINNSTDEIGNEETSSTIHIEERGSTLNLYEGEYNSTYRNNKRDEPGLSNNHFDDAINSVSVDNSNDGNNDHKEPGTLPTGNGDGSVDQQSIEFADA